MSDKHGFTLVELIAVIVIISLLLVILVPNISRVANNSKVSMKDSKINIIKTAAEKYGNDTINKYQNCTGDLSSDDLKSNCTVSIQDLVKFGYIESDKENDVIDPVTNKALQGKALLCYDPITIKVNASYVENDSYECASYDLASGTSLMLSSSKGSGNIGGDDLKVRFTPGGEFTGFECSSSDPNYATCTINRKTMIIQFSKNREQEFNEDGYKNVEISLIGKYKDPETGEIKSHTRKFDLQVYLTNLAIPVEGDYCIAINDEEDIKIESKNTDSFKVSVTPVDMLEANIIGNTLQLRSKTKTGPVNIIVQETIGGSKQTITKNIYNFGVTFPTPGERKMPVDTSKKVSIVHGGVGKVTVTTSNKNVLMLSTSDGNEVETIEIDEAGEYEFEVHAKQVGTAKLTVKPESCAPISEAEFTIINMSLEENELTTYAGSTQIFTTEITADDPTDIKCTSTNTKAATCEVDGTTLKVIPGSVPDENVTIRVSNPSSGFATMKVHVLPTSIAIKDYDGNDVNYICTEIGTRNNDKQIFVNGTNLAEIDIKKDDYLLNATVEGDSREIIALNTNVISNPPSPYKLGYNTGKTTLTLTEKRGNKSSSVDFYIYSLDLNGHLDESGVDVIKTGEMTSFEIDASMTGEISISIDNPDIVSATIDSFSAYQEGINVKNNRTVRIKGLSIGDAIITVKGTLCGEKKYKVRVEPLEFQMNFKPGTYTSSVASELLQCATEGSETTCEIETPEIYPLENFEEIGYSYIKDSLTKDYKARDKIVLDKNNTGKTLYANSHETIKPVCEFSNIPHETKVGETIQIDLRCSDAESGFKNEFNLTEDNFVFNDNITFTSIIKEEAKEMSDYIYRLNLETKTSGVLKLTLKEKVLTDKFNNTNEMLSFNGVVISDQEEDALELWEVGKVNDDDIIAALYQNEGDLYKLKLYGQGDIKDFISLEYRENAPWYYEYASTINEIDIEDKITNVGDYAFYGVNNIQKLKLSKNTKYIGNYAFNQSDLESIDLPEGLIDIRDNAFSFNNLETITIPSSVEEIGPNAFTNYINSENDSDSDKNILKNIIFAENSKLKTIGKGAFQQHHLVSLTIPDSVETIENDAFQQDKTTLQEVTFGENSKLKKLGDYAFAGTELTKFDLPQSVEEIGDYAISTLNGIASIKIGKNLSHIGDTAITGKGLINFEVDEENPNFTSIDGIIYTKDLSELVKCPDSYGREHPEIKVLDEVKIFRAGSFNTTLDYDRSISWPKLVIPSSVLNINIENNFQGFSVGSYEFNNDLYSSEEGILFNRDKSIIYLIPTGYNATNYTIPDTVKEIYPFFGYMNFKIENIVIPPSVTKAGNNAFTSDSKYSFKTIDIQSDDIFEDDGAFLLLDYDKTGYSSRTITVSNNTILNAITQNYLKCDDYEINEEDGSLSCLAFSSEFPTMTIELR